MYNNVDKKIIESVFNIDMVTREISVLKKDTREIGLSRKTKVYTALQSYIFIQYCIILDELQLLEGLAKDNIQLKSILEALSPITRKLKKYRIIREMRNSVHAHLNRDKKKEFSPYWSREIVKKGRITEHEFMYITAMFQLINTVFLTVYYKELESFSDDIKNDFLQYYKETHKEDFSLENYINEVRDLFNETESKLRKIGIQRLMNDPYL